MRNKLTSRKFWLSVAAFLGAVAVSVSGIATGEKWLAIAGAICGTISSGLYAAVEAYTDGAHAGEKE